MHTTRPIISVHMVPGIADTKRFWQRGLPGSSLLEISQTANLEMQSPADYLYYMIVIRTKITCSQTTDSPVFYSSARADNSQQLLNVTTRQLE